MNLFSSIALSILLLSAAFVEAAPVRLYNKHTFGDWKLYEGKDEGRKVCYAVSEPYRTRGFYGIKSKSWISITFLGKDKFTVSGNTGFNTLPNSEWILKVDNNHPISLQVLPNGSIWSYSSKQDIQILNAMQSGLSNFTVRSYSTSNQTSLDYYSLKGVRKAISYMNQNCR
jgi:hypothetical protein